MLAMLSTVSVALYKILLLILHILKLKLFSPIDVNGFVSKNNFALTEDLTELLVCTSHPFLANLFENSNSRSRSESAEASQEADLRRGGGSAKKRVGTISLSFQFRQQVDKLMLQLKSTASHYIKV